MEGILTIPFQGTGLDDISLYEDDSIWLNLEQEELEDNDNKVSPEDLIAMYNIVLRGESAFTYNSGTCPVSITPNEVILHLTFYVWPSSLDLDYQVRASKGDITSKTQIKLLRSFNQVIPFSKNVNFDYLIDESLALRWLTSSYSPKGKLMSHPQYEVYKNKILFEEESFGVMRFTGKAVGYAHNIDIALEYETPENQGFQVGSLRGDFSSTIQATYINEKGKTVSKSLKLEVPDCLEAMMNTCIGPGGTQTNIKRPDKGASWYEVKYNPCKPYTNEDGDKGLNILWEGWRNA